MRHETPGRPIPQDDRAWPTRRDRDRRRRESRAAPGHLPPKPRADGRQSVESPASSVRCRSQSPALAARSRAELAFDTSSPHVPPPRGFAALNLTAAAPNSPSPATAVIVVRKTLSLRSTRPARCPVACMHPAASSWHARSPRCKSTPSARIRQVKTRAPRASHPEEAAPSLRLRRSQSQRSQRHVEPTPRARPCPAPARPQSAQSASSPPVCRLAETAVVSLSPATRAYALPNRASASGGLHANHRTTELRPLLRGDW